MKTVSYNLISGERVQATKFKAFGRDALLEVHTGPCSCSFCNKSGTELKTLPAAGAKLDGIGWNMIWWPGLFGRWYLRWVGIAGWNGGKI